MAPLQPADIFTVENAKSVSEWSLNSKNGTEKYSDEREKSHAFDDALGIIGFTKMHFQILLLSGMVLMAVIMETMGIGIIMPAAQCDLSLTSVDKGILSAVSFLGIMLTSHLWGYVSDTKGRRKLIIYTILASNLCTLGSSMSTSFISISIFRFMVGVFISAPSASVYAYLGEFNKTANRTQIISYASIFVGFATMYIAFFGWLLLASDWSPLIFNTLGVKPWRFLLIIFALPGTIGAIILFWYPESPKFLLSQGHDDEALNILKNMYESSHPGKTFVVTKLTPEVDANNPITKVKGGWAVAKSMWNQTVPLFKTPYLLYFFVCCCLQYGLFVASGGMGLWFPDIINRITSRNSSEPVTICESLSKMDFDHSDDSVNGTTGICDDTMTFEVFSYFLVLGGVYTLLYLIVSILINPVGRGVIIATSLFISGFSGLFLQWVTEPVLVLVLFCAYIVLAGICISIVNGAAVSIFPTHIRAMAVCLSLMCGRLGSVSGSNVIGLLMEENCILTFNLFAGCVLVCAMLTFFLPCR